MKLWLCIDPGETTGYSMWGDNDLLYADQLPMWTFIDAVEKWATTGDWTDLGDFEIAGKSDAERLPQAMVCEDWQLYPWIIREGGLDFDKCRTARAIGAITHICRRLGIKLVFQGADIKKGAQAAGAEALYLTPVHENRHANDSIQHGVFYLAVNGGPPT